MRREKNNWKNQSASGRGEYKGKGKWEEGNTMGKAGNLYSKQGSVKTISGDVSALKLDKEFCCKSGLMGWE